MTTSGNGYALSPIGAVRSERTDPGDSDHWGDVVSTIVVDERFGPQSLVGLTEFSHVEVLYLFDRLAERDDYRVTRRPRGREDLPAVGVFADRGPRRPNRIGATFCAVVSVDGRELRVRGLDAVDGTPVLDVKPAMRPFLPTEILQPEWVELLLADYFKPSAVDGSK